MSSTREELLKIYNHFGQEKQLEKLREEVEELIEAVKSGNREHMIEEIHSYDTMPVFRQKIDRTLERIETKYYEQEE